MSPQSLIGVVGIDIALSELLQNTVVRCRFFVALLYYKQILGKSLNTNFSLQSFGPGELSYTFVIETDNGRTLVHPQLPEPKAIREEPVVIIISDLETSPGKIRRLLLLFSKRGTSFIRGGDLPGL